MFGPDFFTKIDGTNNPSVATPRRVDVDHGSGEQQWGEAKEYMIYPEGYNEQGEQITTNQPRVDPGVCLRLKTGSCIGCGEAQKAITQLRWHGIPMNLSTIKLQLTTCPPGVSPNVTWAINKDASYSMGQSHAEGLNGLKDLGGKPKLINGTWRQISLLK